jgi:hypothetical protein
MVQTFSVPLSPSSLSRSRNIDRASVFKENSSRCIRLSRAKVVLHSQKIGDRPPKKSIKQVSTHQRVSCLKSQNIILSYLRVHLSFQHRSSPYLKFLSLLEKTYQSIPEVSAEEHHVLDSKHCGLCLPRRISGLRYNVSINLHQGNKIHKTTHPASISSQT